VSLKSWFRHKKTQDEGNGLFVSLEELTGMRKQIRYIRNFSHKKASTVQAGDIKSAFKGRGMEFEEIRAYNFGDDVRDIDWRVTARKQHPYTKVFTEERDLQVYVWLDLSASMLFGTKKELKSVTASKLAALIGWLALEKKDRFGAVIFDGIKTYWFKPQNSRAQLLAIFKKIVELGNAVLQKPQAAGVELNKSLKILEQNTGSRSTIFVISDFNHDLGKIKSELMALAKNRELYLIDVYDILEEKAPKSGEYMVQYAGKKLIFNSGSKEFRRNYEGYFAAKRRIWADFCRQNGCSRIEFRTDMDVRKNLRF